jgi:hypothetical protein
MAKGNAEQAPTNEGPDGFRCALRNRRIAGSRPSSKAGVSRRYKAAAASAVIALSVGVLGAATPAPTTQSAYVREVQGPASPRQPVAAGQTTTSSYWTFTVGDVPGSAALSTDVQKRPSVRPVVAWLKKHARKHYDKLKSAVKKGYDAFKKWYFGLPKPIRATIAFLWSGTLWELFDALVKYFFG